MRISIGVPDNNTPSVDRHFDIISEATQNIDHPNQGNLALISAGTALDVFGVNSFPQIIFFTDVDGRRLIVGRILGNTDLETFTSVYTTLLNSPIPAEEGTGTIFNQSGQVIGTENSLFNTVGIFPFGIGVTLPSPVWATLAIIGATTAFTSKSKIRKTIGSILAIIGSINFIATKTS